MKPPARNRQAPNRLGHSAPSAPAAKKKPPAKKKTPAKNTCRVNKKTGGKFCSRYGGGWDSSKAK